KAVHRHLQVGVDLHIRQLGLEAPQFHLQPLDLFLRLVQRSYLARSTPRPPPITSHVLQPSALSRQSITSSVVWRAVLPASRASFSSFLRRRIPSMRVSHSISSWAAGPPPAFSSCTFPARAS